MNRYQEYQKGYDFKNADRIREHKRNYLRELRLTVIEMLGNRCVKCGFSDIRALQIDHINGGGSKERKKIATSSRQFLNKVSESFINNKNEYQLLCANCNWIKRFENNEHRTI